MRQITVEWIAAGLIVGIIVLLTLAVMIANDWQISGHPLYSFLKDQGSLISGLLAVVAGTAAFLAGRAQANEAKKQNEVYKAAQIGRARATRTMLSFSIVEIETHERELARQILLHFPAVAGSAVTYQRTLPAPTLSAPNSSLNHIADTIAVAESETTAMALATIAQQVQVLDSRYAAIVGRDHEITENELLSNLRMAFEIIARCRSALPFARLQCAWVDGYNVEAYNNIASNFLEKNRHARSFEILEEVSEA